VGRAKSLATRVLSVWILTTDAYRANSATDESWRTNRCAFIRAFGRLPRKRPSPPLRRYACLPELEHPSMRSRRLAILFCAFPLVFASFAFAQTPTTPLDLRSADWSLKQAKSLNAEPKDTVWKFVNEMWGNSDLVPGFGKLCDFHFADLRHSGQLALVVPSDAGGLAECNNVNIFDQTRAGIKDYDFDKGPGSYFDSIEDINGDGHRELIINEVFAVGSQSGHCTALWPVIYAWTGTGYSDVSSRYKNYYRKQLDPSQAPSALEPDDCDKAITAKIQRFLGSHNAGLDDAVKWAKSNDPDQREFAMSVLQDIGTKKAIEYLRLMSDDPDRNIARLAKEFLSVVTNRKPLVFPTIQGELVSPGLGPSSAK
jgi:hypothetical protein